MLVAAGDAREGTGILCNDKMGLCIASEGVFACDEANSGVFTSMVRLASQLQGAANSSPLITIETDDASILVKAYDGHAVALRVPTTVSSGGSNANRSSANGTPLKSNQLSTEPSELTNSGGEVVPSSSS